MDFMVVPENKVLLTSKMWGHPGSTNNLLLLTYVTDSTVPETKHSTLRTRRKAPEASEPAGQAQDRAVMLTSDRFLLTGAGRPSFWHRDLL